MPECHIVETKENAETPEVAEGTKEKDISHTVVLEDFGLKVLLDKGQITHLIRARLKYDLYDFFRGCFWACFYKKKNRKQAQNTKP